MHIIVDADGGRLHGDERANGCAAGHTHTHTHTQSKGDQRVNGTVNGAGWQASNHIQRVTRVSGTVRTFVCAPPIKLTHRNTTTYQQPLGLTSTTTGQLASGRTSDVAYTQRLGCGAGYKQRAPLVKRLAVRTDKAGKFFCATPKPKQNSCQQALHQRLENMFNCKHVR